MKKYFSLLIFGFSIASIQAQNTADAIRLSQTSINGTARFQAMSGAFGSLGGDFSAININPASSAIFNNNQWSVSLSDNILKNDTNYFGTKTNSDKNSISFNQAGAVLVFENNDKKSDWKKFSLAANYENVGNFNNDIFSSGTNQNSLANYFTSYANANNGVPKSFITTEVGETIGDLYSYLGSNLPLNSAPEVSGFQAQQALLGFQGFIIENAISTSTNDVYVTNVRQGGNYQQQNSYSTKGYNGILNFNVSGQYQDWLSVGLNLNSHFTDYRQTTIFTEKNTNANIAVDRVKSIQFKNDIYTYGSGFSFQLGAIAKLQNDFRIGLAYQSPTWYELNDELTQSVQTIQSSSAFTDDNFTTIDPKVVNVYEPYQLQSPSKITGSLSKIFGKKGLISLDVSTKNYNLVSFGPKSEDAIIEKNNDLTTSLKRTIDYRIGGEYRIKKWSLRGGYQYEESPYLIKKIMGDLYGISTGFGYTWGDTKLDVSYAYAKRKSQQQFFDRGLTDYSTTTAINNNVTMTLVFEL